MRQQSKYMASALPKLGAALLCLGLLSLDATPALSQDATVLPVRGVVRPVEEAIIATDLSAKIAEIPFRASTSFAKGDELLKFDCAPYVSERLVFVAELKAHKLELESKRVLAKHKAAGQHEIELARTKVDKAAAELARQDIRIAQCSIKAPFDGRVVELFVQPHEFPGTGKPLLHIINDNQFEIELIVPSDWLRWLRRGAKFDFIADETALTYAATVTAIGATVDPVSQTIGLRGKFTEPTGGVLAGMSGSAKFVVPEG